MKKRIISLFLAAMMLFHLTACNIRESANPGTDNKNKADNIEVVTDTNIETRIFTDSCGRKVELPKEIKSYVPSGPLAQIILYAIAPEEMTGLAVKWYDSAKGIISERALGLPYLGQMYGSANLNIEELALADPQVLIDMGEVKPSVSEDLDILMEQTDIPTVYVESNMEKMPETFRMLGELLGKEEKAEELAQFCEKTYNRTVHIMENVGENRVKGLFLVGEKGLNVLAKTSFQAETFDMLVDNLAVIENPVSKGTGNEVTMEQIALWNPDFILFGPKSMYQDAESDLSFRELKAIKNKNYVEVPEGPHNWMGSPPAVQQYLGLIWLTAELYPEYCDYDVKEEIMEYYRLFYSCELTEEQYEELTAKAFRLD